MNQGSPFSFRPHKNDLVDSANGLRLSLYQWPEYNFTVSVEPLSGPQAEAWPIRDRAYFEFCVTGDRIDGQPVVRVSFANAHVPFERDFPGRTNELLDVVLPLLCPFYAEQVGGSSTHLPIPDRLRPLLLQRGSYYSHRDD